MKHCADQFEIDWRKAEEEWLLKEQYERNRQAQTYQWTTEALARVWALGQDDLEWWESLPRYERRRIVMLYELEQAELERRIAAWEPLCEVFHPDGSHSFYPPKPFRIPSFNSVNHMPSQQEMDEFNARVKRMADQISADWSAGRSPTVFTYDPMLASSVSLVLGKKIEAIEPPQHLRDSVPLSWRILRALEAKW